MNSVIRYVQALDTTATDGSGKTGLAFGDITAKYLVHGGTLTALTTQDITTLGTYQAPSSSSAIRIKELANTDPTKGIYEVHFHDAQLIALGKRYWLFLSAAGARFQPLEIDLLPWLDADVQSAADAKDFFDEGYDPATNKVTGVTNDVGVTQAGADRVWVSAARTLTAGTNIVLAKGTGITGFNDIAATAIVTGGAISTAGGVVQTVASVSAIGGGAITSGSFAADSITSTALASTAATEIATSVWGAATRTLTAGVLLTQAEADLVWSSTTRVLTAGTNIVLAKGVGVTGFNDIAATAIVSGGAITTAGGAVSVVSTVNALAANSVNAAAVANGALDAAAFAAGAFDAVWTVTTRTLTSSGSGGATAAEVWAYANRSLTVSPAIDLGDMANIASLVWEELLMNHPFTGSAGNAVRRQVVSESATVNDAGATTTVFKTTLTSSEDNHYVGQTLLFNLGSSVNQAMSKVITGYVGATRQVTVASAFPSMPVTGDTFELWPANVIAETTEQVWDEPTAEHILTGSTGKALTDAGAGGGSGGATAAEVWAYATRSLTSVGNIVNGGPIDTLGGAVATVVSVANDVGITQAGADKVWLSTTRTLTSAGYVFTQADADKVWNTTARTLTASLDPSAATIATAVWGNATRTLTAGAYLFAQADADKVWLSATRVLTAGTNIVLAKGTGITGLNDIPATAVVSGGAITTSGGAVSAVTTVGMVSALAVDSITAAVVANGAIDAATFAAGALNAVWVATTRTLTASLDPSAAAIAAAVWQDATPGDFTAVGSIGKSLGGAWTALGNSVYTTAALANAPSGGSGGATAGEIAAVVWDTVLAGHLTPGTTGAALNAAGAGGDPWSINLPGSYPPGTAGHRVGLGVPDTLAGAASGLALVGSNMGAVASVTADVGITQAGADKVWNTTTRTLTSSSFVFTQTDADKVWASTARTLTSGANIVLAKGVGLVGLNDITAGDVWDVALGGHVIPGSTGEALGEAASGAGGPTPPSVSEIADAVWDEDLSAHNVPGSTGQAFSIVVRSATATVNDSNPTVLSFKTTLPSSVNDFYVGHTLIITSGVLTSQARRIIAYQGSQKKVTLESALTVAPVNGIRFDIWPDSAMLECANLVWDEAVTGAAHTIPGTSGFLVGAYLNATVSSRAVPGDQMNLTPIYDPAKTAAQAGVPVTLTPAYDKAKTAAQPGDAMSLTAAYDKAKTAAQPGDQMSLSPAAIAALIAALDASIVEGTITRIQAERIMLVAIAAGRTDGAGTTGFHVKSLDGSKNRVSAQTDLLGNRLSVALNGS